LERGFIKAMVSIGDPPSAAWRAGFKHPMSVGYQMLAKPAVKAEIFRQAEEKLFTDMLPLALAAHKQLLTDKAVPASARVQAVKLTYDRTLGTHEAADVDKDLAEMSADELRKALERVTSELDQRPGKARDITPSIAPEAGVFD
jgi:hypothetical protein